MNLIIFIVIAGIWAAFLLPSFLQERREAPGASTRAFARSRALLANVSVGGGAVRTTSPTQARRRMILVGLMLTALATLVVAVVTGSVGWLWVTIGVDVALAAYVTLLLMVKQQRLAARALPRVPVARQVPMVEYPADLPPVEDAPPTVRVIAG